MRLTMVSLIHAIPGPRGASVMGFHEKQGWEIELVEGAGVFVRDTLPGKESQDPLFFPFGANIKCAQAWQPPPMESPAEVVPDEVVPDDVTIGAAETKPATPRAKKKAAGKKVA